MPSRWAALRATAYVGVKEVTLVCRGESVTHPRQPFGGGRIRYRHYLPELARKPEAVRTLPIPDFSGLEYIRLDWKP